MQFRGVSASHRASGLRDLKEKGEEKGEYGKKLMRKTIRERVTGFREGPSRVSRAPGTLPVDSGALLASQRAASHLPVSISVSKTAFLGSIQISQSVDGLASEGETGDLSWLKEAVWAG